LDFRTGASSKADSTGGAILSKKPSIVQVGLTFASMGVASDVMTPVKRAIDDVQGDA